MSTDTALRPAGEAGFCEALMAIWRKENLPTARAALARDEERLQRLIAAEAARFAMREIGAGEEAWPKIWNRRGETKCGAVRERRL